MKFTAKDGSTFDPVKCQRAGGYWIGPKGSEVKIANFDDAVRMLSAMRKPYWRRPNKNGNWGIVTAR
jgi:hypothetical protein